MPHVITLKAEPRSVLGKKVKQLRRSGLVPANVYGHGMQSTPVQVEAKALEEALRHSTSTTLVDLTVGEAKRPHKVMVRAVRRAVVRGEPIHVDFFAVRMDEKMRATVPLRIRGEAPGVKNNDAMLLHSATALHVEGLPGELPESIDVDVSGLEEIGDAIHARDLTLPEGVTLTGDPEELICRVQVVKAAFVETEAAEAEAEAAEEVAEQAEGVEPASEEANPAT